MNSNKNSKKYKLIFPKPVLKQIGKIDPPEKDRIVSSILALQDDPYPKGKKFKPLKAADGNFIRLRVGDYRVMYRVIEEKQIIVLGVVNRKDLERWIKK